MAEQLTFDLPVKTSRTRGDFFVSEANARAVARIDDTGGWALGKLALIGPEGAGKSHLAHVWAEAVGGRILDRDALVALDVLSIKVGVAVEVPEGALGAEGEEALFHLHNHMWARHLPLLLTAREAPALWPMQLPDLRSRMEAADFVRIDDPDDALLTMVLVKQFDDRQLQVAPELITWLVARIDRSFAAAKRVVAFLDETALRERKSLTVKNAGKILKDWKF